ncbi:hypothetical protein KM043_001806 [Ampulex compressa]|nr:hypothetical protein KM043_001806 [Ampulex compressa]
MVAAVGREMAARTQGSGPIVTSNRDRARVARISGDTSLREVSAARCTESLLASATRSSRLDGIVGEGVAVKREPNVTRGGRSGVDGAALTVNAVHGGCSEKSKCLASSRGRAQSRAKVREADTRGSILDLRRTGHISRLGALPSRRAPRTFASRRDAPPMAFRPVERDISIPLSLLSMRSPHPGYSRYYRQRPLGGPVGARFFFSLFSRVARNVRAGRRKRRAAIGASGAGKMDSSRARAHSRSLAKAREPSPGRSFDVKFGRPTRFRARRRSGWQPRKNDFRAKLPD